MGSAIMPPLPRPHRKWQVQWKPNYIPPEKRLVLTRVYWNRGTPGDGRGCSYKVSVSLCWNWKYLWTGVLVKPESYGRIVWFCLLPCLPLRVHFMRSYGGSFF
jgi:hypothetical protein